MNDRVSADGKTLASLAAYSGDPWDPGNQYFVEAEKVGERLWKGLVWPIIKDCDYSDVLDLAAGHGRNSVFLLDHAQHLTILDIQDGNVEVCRARFKEKTNVSYLTGNGFDFYPLTANSMTLIYCFDAMVHFDSDVVRSYLRDALRVLKPGGRGFFHHSNYIDGHDWRRNPNARNFMSKELFEHYSLKEGLTVVSQQVINWGNLVNCDCITMVEREA